MSPDRRQPTKGHLEQLIGRYSRDTGIAADRVRRWVSTMALLGALDRVPSDPAAPLFLLKGGVAIELRVRMGARATKDVDVVFRGGPDELVDALDEAFAQPYCDFAFLRGEPADHGPHARRFDVRLTYQSRAWATVRLEASRFEVGADEAEYLDAISLEDFKLSGPRTIACLPLRFQIAQKLHAVSERPVDRVNAASGTSSTCSSCVISSTICPRCASRARRPSPTARRTHGHQHWTRPRRGEMATRDSRARLGLTTSMSTPP